MNGQFILGSTRRQLWVSTLHEGKDDRHRWNDQIFAALCSSYTSFLENAREYIFCERKLYQKHDLLQDIQFYYSLFPVDRKLHDIWINLSGDWRVFANNVFKSLHSQNCHILASIESVAKVSQNDSKQGTFGVKWSPLINNDNPEYQSYFLINISERKEREQLRRVLENLKMNVNSVPKKVWNGFEIVKVSLPFINKESVFKYFLEYPQNIGQLPQKISETSFQSLEDFMIILEFILSDDLANVTQIFPEDPENCPFLLTADQMVRCFNKANKVVCSEYATLFHDCSNHFLHPSLVESGLDPTYFYQPDSDDFPFVSEILATVIPPTLRNVETCHDYVDVVCRDRLKHLWKCIVGEPAFFCHLFNILETWALIPSTDNDLFLHSSTSLLPVQLDDEDGPIVTVFQCLKMPLLNSSVASFPTEFEYCARICNHSRVLSNLVYLHQRKPIDTTLSSNRQYIATLFEYFQYINFKVDPLSKANICSLPVFEAIDGRLTSLANKSVFVWPNNVELAGLSTWIQYACTCNSVFLKEDGQWTKLGRSSDFGIASISPAMIYTTYIFPFFSCLSEKERYKHLLHIRNQLFSLCEASGDDDSTVFYKKSDFFAMHSIQ